MFILRLGEVQNIENKIEEIVKTLIQEKENILKENIETYNIDKEQILENNSFTKEGKEAQLEHLKIKYLEHMKEEAEDCKSEIKVLYENVIEEVDGFLDLEKTNQDPIKENNEILYATFILNNSNDIDDLIYLASKFEDNYKIMKMIKVKLNNTQFDLKDYETSQKVNELDKFFLKQMYIKSVNLLEKRKETIELIDRLGYPSSGIVNNLEKIFN